MDGYVKISISIPKDELAEIDEVRSQRIPMSRSAWIAHALGYYLWERREGKLLLDEYHSQGRRESD